MAEFLALSSPNGNCTRDMATAIHRDEAGRKKHEEMGFQQGWGTVLDQLVEYVKKEKM